jgi:hypothetical protein
MCGNCLSTKSTNYNIIFNHPRNTPNNGYYKGIYDPLFQGNAVLGPYKRSCYPKHSSCHNRCNPYTPCHTRTKCRKICPKPCPKPCRPICYPPRCEPYYTESIYWY